LSELVSTCIRATTGKLGLPHVAEALNQYVQRADEAKTGRLGLPTWCFPRNWPFAATVASARACDRRSSRTARRWRTTAFQPARPRPAHSAGSGCLVVRQGRANAVLLGPPGVGKTRIAVATSRADYAVCFTCLDDMVPNLTAAEVAGR